VSDRPDTGPDGGAQTARAARRERRSRRSRGDRRRAIYLLPNLITTAALLLGFWSIVSSFHGRWERAALGIVLAGICDMLDGRVARATQSTSKFGVEYDSLADLIAYGVAPALLVYTWALEPLGPRGWLIASLFTICAALRLARFNVQQHVEEATRYQGLPSTFAGGFVAVAVWFVHSTELAPPFSGWVALAIAVVFASLALLMVSSVPYLGIKSFRLSARTGFSALVAVTLALIVILMNPEPVLFGIGAVYVMSGPVLWSWERRRLSSAARGARSRAEGESRGDVR
jgi:CDP-diacylglycerol--serine O-phosphatidyltransferase